jgi:hypothetical protein
VKLRLFPQLMEEFEEEDKPLYANIELFVSVLQLLISYSHALLVYLYPFVDKFLAEILETICSSIYQNYIVPKCTKFIRSDI